MKYAVVILDEDGEIAWSRQQVWDEFGEQLAQEVVSDCKVLFAGDYDYLFALVDAVADSVLESKAVHTGVREQLAFHNGLATGTPARRQH